MDEKKLILCQCGCGKKVKPGNKYIRGHNSRCFSEEAKRKIGLASKGRIPSKEARKRMSEAGKGRKFTKEHRRKMSEASKKNKGSKHSQFLYGKVFILNEQHKRHKKQECYFECESTNYDLHHKPKLDYEDILNWEGELINLCHSCHMKVHRGSLKLPNNIGTRWSTRDTKECLKVK